MEPKSVETPRIIAFEFFQRCGQHKGKPAERKMQEKVMEAITSHEDWHKTDDPKEPQGFVFEEKPPEPAGEAITKEEGTAIEMWGLRQREWLDEAIFISMDRKMRAFLWKTFYVPIFEDELTPQDEKHLDRIAEVLGKKGSLADMREDAGEWEDAEDEEEDDGDA